MDFPGFVAAADPFNNKIQDEDGHEDPQGFKYPVGLKGRGFEPEHGDE
jgi:hypothetical protein